MKDIDFVKSKLANLMMADDIDERIVNNRVFYDLTFSTSIGKDWIEQQVYKFIGKYNMDVEFYKVKPGNNGEMVVVIREVDRRPDIDTSQKYLQSFEE